MKIRNGVRLIVVNEGNEVLMFRYRDDKPIDSKRPGLTDYWVTPGGGVEPDETDMQAARRELLEETGISEFVFGELIFNREIELTIAGEKKLCRENYYRVDVAGRTEVDTGRMSDSEKKTFVELRWWPVDELAATSATVLPNALPGLLPAILQRRQGMFPMKLE